MSVAKRGAIRHADRVLARGVCMLLLAIYTITTIGVPDTWRGEVEYQSVSALARGGTLALGGTPEADALIWFASQLEGDTLPLVRIPAGDPREADSWYARSGPGVALFGLPFWLVGRSLGWAFPAVEERHASVGVSGRGVGEYFSHLLFGWRNALLSAATGLLLVLASRRLGATRRAAWIAAMTWGMTTYVWPGACGALPDVQTTFFLFLAFHLVLRVAEGFEELALPRLRSVLGIGAALAAALLTQPSQALLVLLVAGAAELLLWRGTRRALASRWQPEAEGSSGWQRVLALFAPIALAALLVSLTPVGRLGFLGPGYDMQVHRAPARVLGLLAAPGLGLVWMAPLILLLAFGVPRAQRLRRHPLLRLALSMLAVACVSASLRADWAGGVAYGPRLLLPALPFLFVLVALFLSRELSRLQRAVFGVTLALGLVVQAPFTLVSPATTLELAGSAAEAEWPEESDLERATRLQWDLRFATPWAAWRVLRHRVAGLDEVYSPRELFFLDDESRISPNQERQHGFQHLAWVDLGSRLGISAFVIVVLVLFVSFLGIVFTFQGLSPGAP